MLAVTTDSESNQPGRLAHDGPAHYGRPEAPQTTVVLEEHIRLCTTPMAQATQTDARRLGQSGRALLFVSAVYRAGMTWLSVRRGGPGGPR